MTTDRNLSIVHAVADLVEEHYVFADLAGQLAAILRSSAHDPTSDKELADLVTSDLQSLNGDKHLRLLWHEEPIPDPADPAEFVAAHLQQAKESSYGVHGPTWLEDIAVLTFEPLFFDPS